MQVNSCKNFLIFSMWDSINLKSREALIIYLFFFFRSLISVFRSWFTYSFVIFFSLWSTSSYYSFLKANCLSSISSVLFTYLSSMFWVTCYVPILLCLVLHFSKKWSLSAGELCLEISLYSGLSFSMSFVLKTVYFLILVFMYWMESFSFCST